MNLNLLPVVLVAGTVWTHAVPVRAQAPASAARAALVKQLTAADPQQRGRALLELRAHPDPAVVPLLTAALASADEAVADAILRALDLFDDTRKIGPLVAVLGRLYPHLDGESVAAQLGRLGRPAAEALLNRASNCGTDAADSLSADEWAAFAAGRTGEAGLPVVLAAAKSHAPCRRWAAMFAVAQYGRDHGCEPHEPCPARSVLLGGQHDSNPLVVSAAERGLATLDWEGMRSSEPRESEVREPLSDEQQRALAGALASPDPLVRVATIESLSWKDAPTTAPLIAPLVDDPDERVRAAAVNVLCALDAPEDRSAATPPEREIARHAEAIAAHGRDASDAVREAVANALGEVDAGSGTALQAELLLVADKNPAVREAATRALGLIGDELGAPALLRALSDPHPPVRAAAVRSLQSVYHDRRPPASAVEPLIAVLADEESRDDAVVLLGRTKDTRAVAPLVRVLDQPVHAEWQVRAWNCHITAALAEIGDTSAVPPLLPFLASANAPTRECVAAALGQLKDRRAVEGLLRTFKDATPQVREAAATALGAIGDRTAVPRMIAALADQSDEFRGTVAKALARIGDPAAVQPIIDILPLTVQPASEALAVLGDPRAVGPLIEMLKGHDPGREFAAGALGALGDPRAVPALAAALRVPKGEDPLQGIFRAAALALGTIATEEAVAALQARLAELPPGSTWEARFLLDAIGLAQRTRTPR